MSALSALGVAPETPSFPAVVVCPLCQQNALHLFDDIFTDGIWLHCNSCLAHGDIITFGAQSQKISVPVFLTKLSNLGVVASSEIDHFAGEYTRAISRLQAAELFWSEAAAQVWNHGDDATASRLRKLGFREEIAATGGLVGVAHPDQIAALCRAVGRSKPPMIRKHGICVVLPYYDLPGRLTGFLLLREKAEIQQRYFLSIDGYRRSRPNAGYFLLNALIENTVPALKGKQFVLDDPVWVLSEQCRQLRHEGKILPMVAGYCGDKSVSYGASLLALGPATRIFQTRVATPDTLSQAISARGHVATLPLDVDTPRTQQYTIQRLGAIYRAAVPWHQSLHTTLSTAGELTAYSFATSLTAPHDKLHAFFQKYADHYTEDFKTRVLQSIKLTPAEPTRVLKKWTLIEQNNNWFTHTGQLICNAKIVIEKIVQADNSQRYIGRIYQHDWELPFNDTAQRIEGMGLLAYANALAAPHGKLINFVRSWNKRSLHLALQLHPPAISVISTKLGWDTGTNTFQFGNYVLSNTGELSTEIPAEYLKVTNAFPTPTPVAPIQVRQFLTPGPQNAFVWNVFAAIVADLLAPAANKDCVATAVVPHAFDVAAKIGRALSCEHIQTTNLQRGSAAAFIKKQTDDVNWPVFASSVFDETLLMLAVPKAHNRPVVVKLPPTGATIALSYGWQSLDVSAAPDIATDFSVLRHVLPAYIQRAFRNRLTPATKSGNFTLAILHDLHTWLENTYGATFHLPQAARQLKTPEDAHRALLIELHEAISAGKLDLIPRPRRKDQPKNYLLRRKENWWINRRAVDNYTHTSKNIPPNWLTIIDLLVQDGVFNGEETIHNMPGILIDANWCEQFSGGASSLIREIG